MSSAWYYDADIPSNFTAAGGVAGLGEIVDAAQKQMELVDNTNASVTALNQAYADRIAAIRAATGQTLENPMQAAERDMTADVGRINPALARPQALDAEQFGPAMPTPAQRHAQDFTNRLQDLQKQFPQFANVIRADVPVEKDAEAIAKAADERLNTLTASRSALPAIAGNLAGGVIGSFEDPVQVMSMLAGAGPGVGRTLLARIGSVALKEALVNGAVTASMQPTVQAWREKAGLPHGFDEGLKNTLFAGALGAGLGSAAELLGAAGRHVLSGDTLDRVAGVLREKANLRPDIARALGGDHDAALEALRPIRDALAPAARAAVDLHESISAARDSIPSISSPAVHQANMDTAEAVARDPVANVFHAELDQAKVERIVRDLVPDAPPPRKSESQSLADFLTRAGGVQDQGGELTALGMQNVSRKFVGRLVRDDGRPLDAARELAAEAGFFDHKFGTRDEAVAKSTIADLLDELDAEGKRPADARPDDGGRSYVESRVSDLMQQVGPEVDEKLIGKAVQLAEAEKVPLLEAFDRVAIEAERGHPTPRTADAVLASKNYDPTEFSPQELRSLMATASPHAEAMIVTASDLRVARERLAGLEALKKTKLKGFDGSPQLETSVDQVYYGAGREAVAGGRPHDAYTANERDQLVAETAARIQKLEQHIADGVPSDEALAIVETARSIRRDDPLALPSPEPEPQAEPDEALFTPDDLEGVDPHEDIPFFDDGTSVTGSEMIDDLEELHGLFQLTEACKA